MKTRHWRHTGMGPRYWKSTISSWEELHLCGCKDYSQGQGELSVSRTEAEK